MPTRQHWKRTGWMLALSGLLMGMNVAAAETKASAEPVNEPAEMSAKEKAKFSVNWMLDRCERYLPVCQPAIGLRAAEGQFQGWRSLPLVRPIPAIRVDPRVSHGVTALATGLVLRTARGVATDPMAIDPLRYYSPAQRDMVGIQTPSDKLGELAHPILGTNSFRPTPKSGEDDQSSE